MTGNKQNILGREYDSKISDPKCTYVLKIPRPQFTEFITVNYFLGTQFIDSDSDRFHTVWQSRCFSCGKSKLAEKSALVPYYIHAPNINDISSRLALDQLTLKYINCNYMLSIRCLAVTKNVCR